MLHGAVGDTPRGRGVRVDLCAGRDVAAAADDQAARAVEQAERARSRCPHRRPGSPTTQASGLYGFGTVASARVSAAGPRRVACASRATRRCPPRCRWAASRGPPRCARSRPRRWVTSTSRGRKTGCTSTAERPDEALGEVGDRGLVPGADVEQPRRWRRSPAPCPTARATSLDVHEVHRLVAASVDHRCLAGGEPVEEGDHHGGVVGVGRLARAVDVEEPQRQPGELRRDGRRSRASARRRAWPCSTA